MFDGVVFTGAADSVTVATSPDRVRLVSLVPAGHSDR